jgi:hypothetical protein
MCRDDDDHIISGRSEELNVLFLVLQKRLMEAEASARSRGRGMARGAIVSRVLSMIFPSRFLLLALRLPFA